jgi:hypothetical protein
MQIADRGLRIGLSEIRIPKSAIPKKSGLGQSRNKLKSGAPLVW